MLSNTPGFMRPAVGWLLNGLRKITGYISSLWNAVGNSIGGLYNTIAAVRVHLVTFASTVVAGLLWLRYVWVPAKVYEGVNALRGVLSASIAVAKAELLDLLGRLYTYTVAGLNEARVFVRSVLDWAQRQVARIDAFIDALLRALAHVLSGPDVLAEWLASSTWKALGRYVYAQRDRIFEWLFRGSPSFTAWVARVIEDVLVRML